MSRFLILGNPANRRVMMFQEELQQRGLAPALELSYAQLLRNPNLLAEIPDEDLWVRQDSAGEDSEVQALLLARGYEDACLEGVSAASETVLAQNPIAFGALCYPRQRHLGFLRLLQDVEAIASTKKNWRLLQPPAAIATLFDKRQTSKTWRHMGIPTPLSLDEVHSYQELRARVLAKGWSSVFVKIASSSSASGLAVYRPGREGRPDRIMTTVQRTREGYFNSLKLCRYSDPEQVEEILGYLLHEGAQVECTAPKARLARAYFDLRIVAIAGQPVFTVIRQSRHPVTNLHLGGWRGEWSALRKKLSDSALAAIDESCARVAQSLGCHSIGIDVLVEPDWKTHRVIEANAFGDLLPRLERRGRTVYGWQIEALTQGLRL